MSTEYLRDRMSRVIGRIDTDSCGRQVGRTLLSVVVGTYDPRTDTTYDILHREFGTGNQLATLIWRAA